MSKAHVDEGLEKYEQNLKLSSKKVLKEEVQALMQELDFVRV